MSTVVGFFPKQKAVDTRSLVPFGHDYIGLTFLFGHDFSFLSFKVYFNFDLKTPIAFHESTFCLSLVFFGMYHSTSIATATVKTILQKQHKTIL